MEIIYSNINNLAEIKESLESIVTEFSEIFMPLESSIYLLQDSVTDAISVNVIS